VRVNYEVSCFLCIYIYGKPQCNLLMVSMGFLVSFFPVIFRESLCLDYLDFDL
jgi:hypothetical protein